MTHPRLALLGVVALWVATPAARVTDGERSRTDLNERMTFRCEEGSIALEYQINDRFGTRTLELTAPLDGTPLEQRVQSRRARVAASIDDGQLELRIEREAPFGQIHNRRRMRPDYEGRRLESLRINLEKDGSEHSGGRRGCVLTEPGSAGDFSPPDRATLASNATVSP